MYDRLEHIDALQEYLQDVKIKEDLKIDNTEFKLIETFNTLTWCATFYVLLNGWIVMDHVDFGEAYWAYEHSVKTYRILNDMREPIK